MKNKEDTKVKDIAVLMMAGKGERLFSSLHVKKQFFKLDGKELFLVGLGKFVLYKIGHKGQAPAVLRHALPAPRRGPGVAGRIF